MIKRIQIPKTVRNAVWNNYIGETIGVAKCFAGCNRHITWQNYECGHIIAQARGGKTELNNLVPICSQCNKSIGVRNLEQFRKDYGFNNPRNLLIEFDIKEHTKEETILDFDSTEDKTITTNISKELEGFFPTFKNDKIVNNTVLLKPYRPIILQSITKEGEIRFDGFQLVTKFVDLFVEESFQDSVSTMDLYKYFLDWFEKSYPRNKFHAERRQILSQKFKKYKEDTNRSRCHGILCKYNRL